MPAAASTSPSYSPSSSFLNRVSTLPRMATKVAPWMTDASCARRLTLLVPIDGCSPRTVSAVASSRSRPASREAGRTMASRGSSLGSAAATSSPSGRLAGMSFALWTARSMSPLSRASSISFTKSRLVPDSDSGAALEPIAARLDDDDLDARACRLQAVGDGLRLPQASRLPRVPSLSARIVTSGRPSRRRPARPRLGPAPPPPGGRADSARRHTRRRSFRR